MSTADRWGRGLVRGLLGLSPEAQVTVLRAEAYDDGIGTLLDADAKATPLWDTPPEATATPHIDALVIEGFPGGEAGYALLQQWRPHVRPNGVVLLWRRTCPHFARVYGSPNPIRAGFALAEAARHVAMRQCVHGTWVAPGEMAASLEQAGFRQVRRYGAFGAGDRPTYLFPLDSRAVAEASIGALVSPHRTRLIHQAGVAGLRFAARKGLLAALSPALLIMAVNPPQGRDMPSLPLLSAGVHLPPSQSEREHATVHVTYRDGETAFFVKVARGKRGVALMDNAHRMLSGLKDFHLRTVQMPGIGRYYSASPNVRVSVERPLWDANRRPGTMVEERHIAGLAEMMNVTAHPQRFVESGYRRLVGETLTRLRDTPAWQERGAAAGLTVVRALTALDAAVLPFGVCHREINGHVLLDDQRMNIIDWETARLEYPPFFDAFKAVLLSRGLGKDSLERRVERTLFRECEEARLVRSYGQRVGVGQDVAYFLLPLFLLDQITLRLEIGTAPDAQVVDLLGRLGEEERFSARRWLGIRTMTSSQ